MYISTIGFKSALACYLRTNTKNIAHTKEVLNRELKSDSEIHFNRDQIHEIEESITQINSANERCILENIISLVNKFSHEQKNSNNVFSMIVDTINDLVYEKSYNVFGEFENKVDNFLYVQPEKGKEVSKILRKDFDHFAEALYEKYHHLSDSQISSLLQNIDAKVEYIKHAKSSAEVMSGLKGIKVLINHNLRNNAPLLNSRKNLLFLGIDADEGFWDACKISPELHPEWCYFVSRMKELHPHQSEEDMKKDFRKILEDGAVVLPEAILH